MRKLLAFALLFLSAAAAQAQEPVPQQPVAPKTVADAPETAADARGGTPASRTDAPTVDLKTRSATAAAIDAATVRAPVDMDQPAQDITAPRNFWWLVGAIVLGGLILAVLL